MTREKMIEALANAIESALWENSDEGTFDHGANSQAIVHDMAKASAAAVLDLCGPEKLVWQRNGNHWAGDLGYVVRKRPPKKGRYMLTIHNQFDRYFDEYQFDRYFDELEAAQATAQAHADSSHWANTKLGDLMEGPAND